MQARPLKGIGAPAEDLTATPTSRRVEPLWRVAKRLHRRDVPDSVLGWLLDPASLTRRVQLACAGRFEVEVLVQRWARPHRNELRTLGMRDGCRALIREVYLTCNHRPWVYARTVIPGTTLTGSRRRLAYLRNRPLGAVLFADPGMTRGPVEIAGLVPGDRLYADATRHLDRHPERIWGRRSLFRLGGAPLLVSEIFLPGIPACC
jgi:chorismate--pyruvate lyase